MTDILIIGGGIIGMLTARELALAGAKVTLLERGEMASESSWAGGGILSPLYPWRYSDSVTRLASLSQAVYPDFCAELLENTGANPEYTPSGLLIIAPDEAETARRWAKSHGQNLKQVNSQEISLLEPELSCAPDQGLWMPSVGQVRNPRFARALLTDIRNQGVVIHTQTEVLELVASGQQIKAVRTSDGLIEADAVIVCSGAWTGGLLGSFAHTPEIEPVRGQMLLFHGDPGAIKRMVLEENRYIIPRQDGRVLFGSTLEYTGFDKSTTQEARQELEQLAIQRFPILKNFPIEKHWAGLRPGAPAGVPYIGQHPEFGNLYVNAGHFRNGVVLGPASARLAADLVLGRAPKVAAGDYSLRIERV